jgi:ABC-type phosphate transport system permease subunit
VIVVTMLFQAGIGGLLIVIGEWGARHAADLVPVQLGEVEREHRQRIMRRGGRTCQAAGVVFVLMIVPLWL